MLCSYCCSKRLGLAAHIVEEGQAICKANDDRQEVGALTLVMCAFLVIFEYTLDEEVRRNSRTTYDARPRLVGAIE